MNQIQHDAIAAFAEEAQGQVENEVADIRSQIAEITAQGAAILRLLDQNEPIVEPMAPRAHDGLAIKVADLHHRANLLLGATRAFKAADDGRRLAARLIG